MTKTANHALSAWGAVLVMAPALLFPTARPRVTAIALVIGAAWLGWSSLKARRFLPDTPLKAPLALLSIFVLAGAWWSPARDLMLPKLGGVALGMLIFRAMLITLDSLSWIWFAVAAFLLTGTGGVVAGVLSGPTWRNKFPTLDPLIAAMPHVLPKLAGAQQGVNTNALGGATMFALPLLLVLAFGVTPRIEDASNEGRDARLRPWLRTVCLVLAAALLLVLIATQSRGSWLAAAVSVAVIVGVRWRRIGFGLVAAVLLIAAAVTWVGPARARQVMQARLPGTIGFDLVDDDRAELWGIARRELRAHPVVGVGLGAFRRVALPLTRPGVYRSEDDIGHAHNVFLQTALDVGLPGLIGYVWLIGLAGVMCLRCCRTNPRGQLRGVALGLLAVLVAVHTFGMLDAFALGSRVGVLVWAVLGLIGAIDRLRIPIDVR